MVKTACDDDYVTQSVNRGAVVAFGIAKRAIIKSKLGKMVKGKFVRVVKNPTGKNEDRVSNPISKTFVKKQTGCGGSFVSKWWKKKNFKSARKVGKARGGRKTKWSPGSVTRVRFFTF